MRRRVSPPIFLTAILAFLSASLCVATPANDQGSMCIASNYKSITLRFDKPITGFMVMNTTIKRTIGFGFRARQVEVPVYSVHNVTGSEATLCVPNSISRLSIMGPFSKEQPLLPFKADFDASTFSGVGNLTLHWPVKVGYIVLIRMLPFLNGSYPKVAIEGPAASEEFVSGLRPLSPAEQMRVGDAVPELFFMVYRAVLPAEGEAEVVVKVDVGSGTIEFKKRVAGEPGSEVVFEEVSQFIVEVNQEELRREMIRVNEVVAALERSGYYLGSSRQLLSLVESIGYGDDLLSRVSMQKLKFTLLTNLEASLTRLISGPSFDYAFALLVSLLLLSLAVGWQSTDKWHLKPIFTLLIFATLLLVVSVALPRLRIEVAALAAASVFGFFYGLRALLKLKSIQGASTASGATLEGLLSSTISFSLSFLSRRKLRAALLLSTSLLIAFGVTSLSSFTMYAAISSQPSDWVASVETPYLVIRGYSPLGPVDARSLAFLSGRGEVQMVAPNAILFYPTNPYGRVGQMPVNCIVGVSQGSPLAELLASILLSGSTSELKSGTIVISDAAAKSAGIKVGDQVELGGSSFVVAGIFESSALAKMRDLDGDDVLPTVVMGMSSYKPPAESTVFLYYNDAVLVGAATNKVYVKLRAASNATELARLVSLLGGVNVYAVQPGKTVEVYYPGFRIVVRGAELVVPSVIALLIIFTAFAGFTYEVRKDIFTLSTLGATPDQVFMVFNVMACVVGFIGGVLGYVLGMLAFRLYGLTNAGIPIDVKIDTLSILTSILLPTGLALLGALSPASKAVVTAVPSLRRRWALVAEEAGRDEVEREVILITPIPVVIRSERQAKDFADFIESKLREASGQSIFNVERWEESLDGEKAVIVYFEYYQVEGRAFKSYNKLRITKKNGSYSVELESKIVTIYTMFARELLRDVASIVRRLALEWRTEGT